MKYKETTNRNSEKGSTTIKFALVLFVLFLIGHAGYNYVPTAYEGANLKQEMQTAVVQGMAAPSNINPIDMTKGRLQRAVVSNNIPADAIVQVKSVNGSISAHVSYAKKIDVLPFGIYSYVYKFDHTATPSGFLLRDTIATQ